MTSSSSAMNALLRRAARRRPAARRGRRRRRRPRSRSRRRAPRRACAWRRRRSRARRLRPTASQHERLVACACASWNVLDGEVDVRPVEAADDDRRVAHAEPLDDLVADRRRGGRGQREHRRAAERLDRRAEPQVVGAEVVAPLADAVRLVDDEQRRPGGGDSSSDLGVGELLRGEEEELERRPRASSASASSRSRSGDARVELRGAAAPRVGAAPSTWSRCSAISGETTTRRARRSAGRRSGRSPTCRSRSDRTASVSRPASTASIASRCPGRSASKPKTSRTSRSTCGRSTEAMADTAGRDLPLRRARSRAAYPGYGSSNQTRLPRSVGSTPHSRASACTRWMPRPVRRPSPAIRGTGGRVRSSAIATRTARGPSRRRAATACARGR